MLNMSTFDVFSVFSLSLTRSVSHGSNFVHILAYTSEIKLFTENFHKIQKRLICLTLTWSVSEGYSFSLKISSKQNICLSFENIFIFSFFGICSLCKSKKYFLLSKCNFLIIFLSARFSVCLSDFQYIFFCWSNLIILSVLFLLIHIVYLHY